MPFRNVTVTFADGTTHMYQRVPDGTPPQQVEARAVQESGGKRVTNLAAGTPYNPKTADQLRAENPGEYAPDSPEYQAKYGGGGVPRLLGDVAKSTGDTVATLATGAVAAPVAGLAGAVAAPFVGADRAADIVQGTQQAMTWRPRSVAGQQTQEAIAKPLGWVADKADRAGAVVADATGSPALGAAAATALQGAPAFLAPEVRGAFSAVGGAARSGVTTTLRGVGTAARATTSAVDAARLAAAQVKAKNYAAGTLKLDWDGLGDSVRSKLTQIAADGGDLSQLDAAALAREAKFQSLPVPVPATRGTLTRDAAAMRREANAAATAEGQPIAAVQADANSALIQNLDVLKGRVSGTGATAATASNAEGAGAAVQGAARGKLELQKAKVRKLYEDADNAGETLQTVDATGVLGAVGDTIDQPHYSYAQSWLKANAPKIDAGEITIRDLEKLRKQAVAKAMNGGEDAHYAGELIKAIDATTEGAGGDLYKAARAARRAQATEFQEQGAVADLVDNASRTDRTTALENTVKSITGQSSSLEDIRNIKRTLLTGGDNATRTAGRQAWREVRAQVIQRIKDDATKSVATLPDVSPNLGPGALKSAIDKLGPDKLDELFGPGTTKQLYKILDVAVDAKTIPTTGGAAVGSSTMQNVLTFLSKGLDKVPVVGKTTTNIVKGVSKLGDIGAASREAAAATTTPLSEVAAKAAARARKGRIIGQPNDAAPLVPLGSLYSQKEARQ